MRVRDLLLFHSGPFQVCHLEQTSSEYKNENRNDSLQVRIPQKRGKELQEGDVVHIGIVVVAVVKERVEQQVQPTSNLCR